MTDVLAPETPVTALAEYGVSELSARLKREIEGTFGRVRVRGEVGESKLHSSGHLYFSLKDESAVLACVSWRAQVARLGLKPETGMDVVCTGKITTYAGQSKYQMQVERIELAGQGALLKMLEDRRKKLAAEGLFDAARKKPLPFLPEIVGVVTSPTGAVIKDILHRLKDRFPRRVLLWPVPVQGEGAAAKIAAAIRGFNALNETGPVPRPDVLIVARGGGSLEDLMPFNEEDVVRAVADSVIPVISAVGHETDTTLVDFAADVRAPTPTAAAEMAVPVRTELLHKIAQTGLRLDDAARRGIALRKERLALVVRALGDPARGLGPLAQKLDDRIERFETAWKTLLRQKADRLARTNLRHPKDTVRLAAQKLGLHAQRLHTLSRESVLRAEKKMDRLSAFLEALSPRAVLGRGYGLVYGEDGRLVTRAESLKKGDAIRIELQDSSRDAVIK